ncbi:MAG: hypothetical protein ICV64_07800 [Thermoleophilia bacterium]|nr:hypothetical protein [Thermoleophilia bacterium]
MSHDRLHPGAERAYEAIFTVIHDLGRGEDIAWIRGAIWPPVGTVVELESPERHALVVGIRLVLEEDTALVRVDVQDPREGELIARDAATRVLPEEALSVGGDPSVGSAEAQSIPAAVRPRQREDRAAS